MVAPMAQTKNFPQNRTISGIPPGGSFHMSSMSPSQSESPIASFANSLGEGDCRNSEVQALGKSSSRWQVPGSSSDLHNSTRWLNNSNESSVRSSPSMDTFAFSELFDSSIRGTDGKQQFVDGSGRYSPSVTPMFPVGSSAVVRTMSSSVGVPLGSTSPRLREGWNSTVDRGNLGLTVDPSKGGLALQGVGCPTTPSLARFSANPGFAERAARFSAFGNGQYSPSFPITENGNVGRSPSFENDNCRRSKASAIGSRAASCATDVSDRNSLPNSISSESKAAERWRDDKNMKDDLQASGSRPFTGSGCAQADQDDTETGRNVDEAERSTSDSDASDISRGQQETSCADKVVVDLCRTNSVGKKRKTSTVNEPLKEAACPSSKEHKSSGAQSKRCKDTEVAVEKDEQKGKSDWSGSENSGLSNSPVPKNSSKVAEQPKLDYIHVRARRGQATDSHSLAERVRREKISERMKYLQDLVPGCSKVTGKAVMLDEIINYVQSIQRQVEFLSMKLAAVTPRPDLSIDSILSKQLQIGNGYGLPNVPEHADTNLSFPHIHSQQSVHLQHGVTHSMEFQPAVDMNVRRMNGISMPLPRAPMASFEIGQSQASSLWDGDLQSVVQMGFGQGMQGFGQSGVQCELPPGHMKMEL